MKVSEDTNMSFAENESFIDEDSRSMDTTLSSTFESFTPQPEKQQISSTTKKVVSKVNFKHFLSFNDKNNHIFIKCLLLVS